MGNEKPWHIGKDNKLYTKDGECIENPAVIIDKRSLDVIMFGNVEDVSVDIKRARLIYPFCEPHRKNDIFVLKFDKVTVNETLYMLNKMFEFAGFDKNDPKLNRQLFIKDIIEKYIVQTGLDIYELSDTNEFYDYLKTNMEKDCKPSNRTERLYTDTDEIVINPESTIELRRAMEFKSRNIKAKASGTLFQAVADKLEQLEKIESILLQQKGL